MNRRGFFSKLAAVAVAPVAPAMMSAGDHQWVEYGLGFEVTPDLLVGDQTDRGIYDYNRQATYLRYMARRCADKSGNVRPEDIKDAKVTISWKARK